MLFVVARSRTDAVFDDTARFGDAVHGGNDRAPAALQFFNGLLARCLSPPPDEPTKETMRLRTLILALGLPVYTFGLMVVGTVGLILLAINDLDEIDSIPESVLRAFGESEWWMYAGTSALVLVALQAVFLIPMFQDRPPRERRGKSLTASLVLAGILAGLLTLGLGAGAMELIRLLSGRRAGSEDALWLLPLGAVAAGWIFWTLLLLTYVRGIWADRTLGRIVGVLIAGTVLETLIVLPIDVMVRRRTDCYCATGTFIALLVCGVGALWLAGPGVVIAIMSGKHRRWRESHCERCGYAKGPSPGARCAECGHAWRGAARRTLARLSSPDAARGPARTPPTGDR